LEASIQVQRNADITKRLREYVLNPEKPVDEKDRELFKLPK
jgi:hypothetical protein